MKIYRRFNQFSMPASEYSRSEADENFVQAYVYFWEVPLPEGWVEDISTPAAAYANARTGFELSPSEAEDLAEMEYPPLVEQLNEWWDCYTEEKARWEKVNPREFAAVDVDIIPSSTTTEAFRRVVDQPEFVPAEKTALRMPPPPAPEAVPFIPPIPGEKIVFEETAGYPPRFSSYFLYAGRYFARICSGVEKPEDQKLFAARREILKQMKQ